MAAATNSGVLKFFKGSLEEYIELNSYDRRFYYAALDAMLNGDVYPDFDLGRCSDGKPAEEVKVISLQ